MARRPESSGPISRVLAQSVQVARLAVGDDGKSVRAEPISRAAPDVVMMMAGVRERAADVVPLESRIEAVIAEQQRIVDDHAACANTPSPEVLLAKGVLMQLNAARKFLPNWSQRTRTAFAFVLSAGSLLERQDLLPVEPTTRTALENLKRLKDARDAHNKAERARANRNVKRMRSEAALHWRANPKLSINFIGHDIEVRQQELGIEPRPVFNRQTEEYEHHPVGFDTIAKAISRLRPRKSRNAR
jgi:hypothetical protein